MSDAYCFFRISYSLTIQKMCPLWIKYAQSLSKNQNKPNMTKIFFELSKEFQKLSNSFRILSSVSMKYCSMRKEERFALPKNHERDDKA